MDNFNFFIINYPLSTIHYKNYVRNKFDENGREEKTFLSCSS